MSFEPRDYLRHILAEADYLLNQCTGLTFERFVTDETLRRAFVRSLEVIGEAAKKVPDDFRAQHSSIEWRAMSGMRDRLIHDYLGVDLRNWCGMLSRTGFRSFAITSLRSWRRREFRIQRERIEKTRRRFIH